MTKNSLKRQIFTKTVYIFVTVLTFVVNGRAMAISCAGTIAEVDVDSPSRVLAREVEDPELILAVIRATPYHVANPGRYVSNNSLELDSVAMFVPREIRIRFQHQLAAFGTPKVIAIFMNPNGNYLHLLTKFGVETLTVPGWKGLSETTPWSSLLEYSLETKPEIRAEMMSFQTSLVQMKWESAGASQGFVRGLHISQDGKVGFVHIDSGANGRDDDRIGIFQTTDFKRLLVLNTGLRRVINIQTSPSGRYLVVRTMDNVKVFELQGIQP